MTKILSDGKPRRLPKRFPTRQTSSAEKARRQAESDAFYQRCRAIFERVCPELIEEHYNWYIIIEPDSKDYSIDLDEMVAIQKMREQHPQRKVMIMRLNETGTCGRI
ncbi:MAG TPA: hypothetical protein DCE56_06860 [Cyanobacteria bacterium UBA8553]|nr:hypothetical protein [Cyanobacteria bacterium UBA8553]HAJ58221.1 hypothetical protein [Cyanobacteria bacterium UBA8543]